MNEMVKMRALSAYELVQVWEWGQPQHPVDRARGLLTLAQPELSPAQLDQLSVGQRNTRLLMLREQTLGSTLNGYAECTACGEPLEFSVDVSTIRLPEPQQHEFDLQASGFDLHCRLPNSRDLASIVGLSDTQAARQLLIERCVMQAHYDSQPWAVTELPESLIPTLANAVIEHDPQAEIRFTLQCPACEQEWSALFDIVTYFWTELENRVKHLLHEVHLLAQTYGWREADILTMSAARREFYLKRVTNQD